MFPRKRGNWASGLADSGRSFNHFGDGCKRPEAAGRCAAVAQGKLAKPREPPGKPSPKHIAVLQCGESKKNRGNKDCAKAKPTILVDKPDGTQAEKSEAKNESAAKPDGLLSLVSRVHRSSLA